MTESGQVFVRGCKDSLAILERAVRSARSMQDDIQPVVTIGHGPYVDPLLFSALLSVHLPLYPNLRLRMESMFPHELLHSVLSAELDMAIVDDPIENPLLTQVSLTATPLHAVMAADDPAAQERTVAKVIEAALLCAKGCRRRFRRVLLERAMHPLMAAVLLRSACLNALVHDPKLHPSE